MKKRYTEQELVEYLRKRSEKRGGKTILSKSLNISPGYLSDILNGKTRVGEVIAEKLGYRMELVFVLEE